MKSKECSKCKKTFAITNFSGEKRAKDGLRSECKICQYEMNIKSLTKKVEEIKKCTTKTK